ncbi:glycoside hydrolase family 43 protein [Clostridium folliculivorans]|uniref:Glycosyl hydrolase n=1 Tax=Clostridium folliculivorans TaxID=2886038 RepID=A0A9W5Y1T1_9CLOT|nr:glycoside hydrolase family 43 protein [Clostridium folliculivorans]GKU24979.1 glycosyl hydrolase [Clostridium folliculivorans]GKU31077.1 glycosyl hydrolase [Clostridium folliculivorans]
MVTNCFIKPLIEQRADPYVYKHTDGYYYFTASVPTYDYIELRRAKTIDGLALAETTKIWQRRESGVMSEHIWAPELHYLDEKWYVYFAAGEKEDVWKIRPFVLECTGDDPMKDSWIERGMMQKAEVDPYSFTDFSLDATVFENNSRKYIVWAQKVGGEGGISNLYIAEMESPIKLKTVQVLLTTPDYDWERVDYWVNEGPAVIKRNGKIFITFSASSTGAAYCMGLLEASDASDLLDPQSWSKTRYPVFSTCPEKNIFGPGHNSFTVSENGEDLVIYHARPYEKIVGNPLYDYNRHTMVMKLKWDAEGRPVFDLE